MNHVKTREAFAKGMREARICVVSSRNRDASLLRPRTDRSSFGSTVRREFGEEDDSEVSVDALMRTKEKKRERVLIEPTLGFASQIRSSDAQVRLASRILCS